MEQIIEQILNPAIVWVLIPLAGVLFWGASSIIRALRGAPADLEEIQAELHDLRTRVEELERERHAANAGNVKPARVP